eukprot:3726786-Amphidinium_carterae.1
MSRTIDVRGGTAILAASGCSPKLNFAWKRAWHVGFQISHGMAGHGRCMARHGLSRLDKQLHSRHRYIRVPQGMALFDRRKLHSHVAPYSTDLQGAHQ